MNAGAMRADGALRYDWRTAGLVFAGFAVLCLVLFHGAFLSMVRVWANSATFNHGFLVLPISLYLMWQTRGAALAHAPAPAPIAALGVLAGAGLWLLGEAAFAQIVLQVGALLALVCGFVAIFGWAIARAWAFPLGFLVFMAPIGESLVPWLQDVTASAIVVGLDMVKEPVWREGVMLTTASGRYHVAEACAGLRFLIANVVVATLFAWLAYDRWGKRIGFVVLAFLLPVFANMIRAFAVVLIATRTDNQVAADFDHLVYGWGFFTAIMLAMLFIGAQFADRPIGPPPTPEPPETLPESRIAAPRLAPAFLAVLLPGVYALAAMPGGAPGPAPELAAPAAEGWRTARTRDYAVAEWRLDTPAADAVHAVDYEDEIGGAQDLRFSLAYYVRERQGAEVVYYDNRAYDGETWRRTGTETRMVTVGGTPVRARIDRLEGPGDRRALAATWYWIGAAPEGDPKAAKLRLAVKRLTGREGPAGIAGVLVPYEDDPEAAYAAIEAFAADLEPWSDYLGRLHGAGS